MKFRVWVTGTGTGFLAVEVQQCLVPILRCEQECETTRQRDVTSVGLLESLDVRQHHQDP